jgi:hypothetical protein
MCADDYFRGFISRYDGLTFEVYEHIHSLLTFFNDIRFIRVLNDLIIWSKKSLPLGYVEKIKKGILLINIRIF